MDAQGRVEGLQADFEGLLDAQVSNSDWVIDALLFSLMFAGFLHFANNLTSLLGQVDANREELCNIDVLIPSLACRRIGIG